MMYRSGMKRSGFFWMMIFFLCGYIGGCSGPSKNAEDTGGVAISIKVVEDDGAGAVNNSSTLLRGISMDFQVHVGVFDADGNEVAKGGPWDWGDGRGTLSGVPPGTDMSIFVSVFDSSNTTMHYMGSIYDVTVVAGETTDLTHSPVYVYSVYDPVDVCSDFSGSWDMVMIDDASQCGGGYSDPYDETYFISQSGCSVEVSVEDSPITLSGWVDGDTMYLENKTITMYGETSTYSNWEFEIFEGMINGYVDWVWDNGYDSCAGSTEFSGMRN